MNALHPAQRSTAAVVVQSLFWLWLIGLSVIVALGGGVVGDLAGFAAGGSPAVRFPR